MTNPIRLAIILTFLFFANTAIAKENTSAAKLLSQSGVQGGLVVHVGCGDGRLTVDLLTNDSYRVHGLDADKDNVAKARQLILSEKLAGKIAVDLLRSAELPLIDNLVNLLVVSEGSRVSEGEITRVLAPGGVAMTEKGGKWSKRVKPRPNDIDQWTHYLHDASGNAVANDLQSGPPRHMQWVGGPEWTRGHHTLASMSAVVSANGRVFSIVDESPAADVKVPSRWSVTARDAFSGVLLWKRDIPKWAYHLRKFRSGPVQLPRTLVTDGPRVYVPLGINAPVSTLDAATGDLLATYEATKAAEELLVLDGKLLVLTGAEYSEQATAAPALAGIANSRERSLIAIDTSNGKVLWKKTYDGVDRPTSQTLAAAKGKVFFQVGRGVVCTDIASGKILWSTAENIKPRANPKPAAEKGKKKRPSKTRGPGLTQVTLVIKDDVVLSAARTLNALDIDTGKTLWSCPVGAGFRSPPDVFVVQGLVWLGPGFTQGRDLHTGEVKKTNNAASQVWTAGHHHRCYRNKATEQFIITGKRGIEFLDVDGDDHSRHNWVRGLCQYGVMPCNGLVYAPPHSCGCFMEAKIMGFWALAPETSTKAKLATDRLEQGPAYDTVVQGENREQDWPTYRGNSRRSAVGGPIAGKLAPRWKTKVGERLTAPVVADGNVLVASQIRHQVISLDAQDGSEKWTYTAGGRIDSPPTFDKGRVLFGSADGWVYCLRATDGKLIWRFLAAPSERKTVFHNQVESVWPVHGNVLIENGIAYFSAGRNSYLDGGIHFYALDVKTGKVLHQNTVADENATIAHTPTERKADLNRRIDQNSTDDKTFKSPDRSDAFSMAGIRRDLLVSDGTSIYLRTQRFDHELVPQKTKGRHLFSTSGLLDAAENHRSHWVLGVGDFSRTPVAYSWIANNDKGRGGTELAVPNGLMLCFDDEHVWGVRRNGNRLFSRANTPFSPNDKIEPDFRRVPKGGVEEKEWENNLPMHPRAMLNAGGKIVLGGMPIGTTPEEQGKALSGKLGGVVWIGSTEKGETDSQYKLASPPVWDGMAVANESLFISTEAGQVICLGP